MSRFIKELIPLSEAKKLIGATVQGWITTYDDTRKTHASLGVVTRVTTDEDGDLRFALGCGCSQALTSPDYKGNQYYIEVLSEPPGSPETAESTPETESPTAKVERLTKDLESAKADLESEGLPEGWRYPNSERLHAIGEEGRVDVSSWARRGTDIIHLDCEDTIPFTLVAALVDRAREYRKTHHLT